MSDSPGASVAIVDYGLGNLFSVRQACEHAGLRADITSDSGVIANANAIVLPGVGAFGDAMTNLRKLELISPIKDAAAAGTPLLGICLGMQLLLSDSSEFGEHDGLDLVPGSVVRFPDPTGTTDFKVPQVGWNKVYRGKHEARSASDSPSESTIMDGVPDGAYMYFVHSYYASPSDPAAVALTSTYAGVDFCSGIVLGNIIGFQFHPERSGPLGLRIYRNFAASMNRKSRER